MVTVGQKAWSLWGPTVTMPLLVSATVLVMLRCCGGGGDACRGGVVVIVVVVVGVGVVMVLSVVVVVVIVVMVSAVVVVVVVVVMMVVVVVIAVVASIAQHMWTGGECRSNRLHHPTPKTPWSRHDPGRMKVASSLSNLVGNLDPSFSKRRNSSSGVGYVQSL